jgi:hypothetical protein
MNMENNMISLGIAAAGILIPLAIDLLDRGTTADGTPLTQEQIDQLRALVDQQHLVVQALPEDGA